MSGNVGFAPVAHGRTGFPMEDGLEERHGIISAEGGYFLDGNVAVFKERHCLFDSAFLDCAKHRMPGVELE